VSPSKGGGMSAQEKMKETIFTEISTHIAQARYTFSRTYPDLGGVDVLNAIVVGVYVGLAGVERVDEAKCIITSHIIDIITRTHNMEHLEERKGEERCP
jgi:hypothetical protein